MRLLVEKFTKDWNEDPNNRDKALTGVKSLTETKEQF